jgi:ATP-dependent exoDNAse (exonuclease V) alpha subunit
MMELMSKNKISLCKHGINSKFCDTCKPKKHKKIKFEGFALSPDQVEAINIILSEKGPFFLTGGAGTGKSFVIRYLSDNVPDCATCAMTGVAAQLIDSRTAHSFLGIVPVEEWMRKKRVEEGQPNPAYCLKEPKINPKTGRLQKDWANENVSKANMIILDEISMASAEFINWISARFKKALGDNKAYWPKLVFVGDLLQLPPVEGEKIFSNSGFDKFKTIQLKKQHRQSNEEDKEFLMALNEIRVGVLSESGKKLLEEKITNDLPKDCTHLHAKNEYVNRTNCNRLEELSGDPVELDWEVKLEESINEDNEEDQEKIRIALHYAKNKESPKIVEKLILKEGARVVIKSNDSANRWVNGSTGEVLQINKESITVRLDRKGDIVEVDRIEEDLLWGWKKIGVILQFPVRLAWAMSIHSSQGLSLDRVGINLSDHFDCGMTYVALSRCRYLEGLHLAGRLPDEIYVDHEALEFLKRKL